MAWAVSSQDLTCRLEGERLCQCIEGEVDEWKFKVLHVEYPWSGQVGRQVGSIGSVFRAFGDVHSLESRDRDNHPSGR